MSSAIQKNMFIFIFILFLFCWVRINAQAAPICQAGDKGKVMNINGDLNCINASNPNVSYTVLSEATLNEEATAQAAIDTQTVLAQQQQTLNQQALQEVIANQIANDPKLSVQQATITKSLNALRAQTK